MRPITINIANVSGRLDAHLDVVVAAFESATSLARGLINAEGIDVLFVDAPDETIPEWGVGGYTYGPHVILVALEPAAPLEKRNIETTLVHEYHHAMRWRGPGCGGNLAQMLVSEGMAQLFEEEALGEAPFFSRVSITDDDVAQAQPALYAQPFSPQKWFYGANGITKAFGYTYGYQLSKTYALAVGRKASELINIPAEEVMGFSRLAT
ncbi:MAG TPA: DUF2268 domain-containing putative Zn-dependent protease [Acidimicrobiales bacterium]|nr:DUF2268 domain-containing putative Zn-dependent protease [Acidimicrobiales bacterium]